MSELTHPISSRTEVREPEPLSVRLAEGDETAFAEAFALYKDLIFGLARSVLVDKSEAMDLTQEVFLTLHRKIHLFRGESTLKTWLYRVTLNQASNRNRWWRRRLRHRTISLDLEASEVGVAALNPVSEEPLQDRKLLSREAYRVLQEGLGSLPARQRTAVILRDMHGLSYEEIAETVGARVGTVKSRIARGRERLREVLIPYWNGEHKK